MIGLVDEIATRYGFPQWREAGPRLLPVALFCMSPAHGAVFRADREGHPKEVIARIHLAALARHLQTDAASAAELYREFAHAIVDFGVEHLEAFACLCAAAGATTPMAALVFAQRTEGIRVGDELRAREAAAKNGNASHVEHRRRWAALWQDFRSRKGEFASLNAAAEDLSTKHNFSPRTIRNALKGKRLPNRLPARC